MPLQTVLKAMFNSLCSKAFFIRNWCLNLATARRSVGICRQWGARHRRHCEDVFVILTKFRVAMARQECDEIGSAPRDVPASEELTDSLGDF